MNKKQKKKLTKIIIAAVLTVALELLPITGFFRFVLYLIPYLLVGYETLKKAYKGILKKQVFDENFLMAVATIGAFVIAFINKSGDYTEAVAVMLFYQIGELFENYAVGKSRKNISALMDIRPDYANLAVGDDIKQVSPDEVEIDSIIVVKPGEKIPIDGIVIEGGASLDTSALTGESRPRSVVNGDEVISGCIVLDSVIRVRTTKQFGESTVSKILDLVENASSRKSKSENFISKFARIYTPTVCYCALALAILPPMVNLIIRHVAPDFAGWIYRALTFLVISCPCALVISIPLGFFAGIGGASRAGVLVKGSNYIESLSKVSTIVFDKTGTLTKGVFQVSDVHHSPISDAELIEYAAYAENYSTHPISRSIVEAYGKEIDATRIADVHEYPGEGVSAFIDGKKVLAGNRKLMKRGNIDYVECHDEGTIVHIAIDGEYFGHILIADVIKETSAKAIEGMNKMGISDTVMLTGDDISIAKNVAAKLKIKSFYAQLMPQDKVSKVEELLAGLDNSRSTLAFVGDGINDAPVLTRADIGIAMGSLGSDAAIEAADVVLMDDDPMGIVKAIKIAKKCMRIVYENIYLAIGIKLVCLALGALGIAGMWLAIFADVGVMILAVLNAIRTLRVPRV